jgi:hypothetical protein
LASQAGVPPGSLNPAAKKKGVKDAIRTNRPDPNEIDDPTLRALASLAGITMPCRLIPVKQKITMVGEALNWVRQNTPGPDDLDKPSLRMLCNLAALPVPGGKLKDKGSERCRCMAPMQQSRPG